MKRHDDDDDEMVGDQKWTAGECLFFVGGRFCILEYGMAVGSSKISCGSWILFFDFSFSRMQDRR